jgi:hypothetical protein
MSVRPSMKLDTNRELEAVVFGLAAASHRQLTDPRTRDQIPTLYTSKIRYQVEPWGEERWQTALETAQRGVGDCEDLVAYRLAELWRDGVKAVPYVYTVRPGLRHVVIKHRDGTIEDPSKQRGMGRKDAAGKRTS